MSGRGQVTIRTATGDDVDLLTTLWHDSLRRSTADPRAAVVRVIGEATSATSQRLLVAEHAGTPAGAALLVLGRLHPLDEEEVLSVLALAVASEHRRHGVGSALMDAAVGFAEEVGAVTMATAVGAGEREPNRFMARLALGPLATVRTAPTSAVRTRIVTVGRGLPGGRPSAPAVRRRTRVLAARRSVRRSQAAG